MLYDVKVTGRRLSDNRDYELRTQAVAKNPEEAEETVLRDHDWEDAATRNIVVKPVLH